MSVATVERQWAMSKRVRVVRREERGERGGEVVVMSDCVE
jgi:hypothetical protein